MLLSRQWHHNFEFWASHACYRTPLFVDARYMHAYAMCPAFRSAGKQRSRSLYWFKYGLLTIGAIAPL